MKSEGSFVHTDPLVTLLLKLFKWLSISCSTPYHGLIFAYFSSLIDLGIHIYQPVHPSTHLSTSPSTHPINPCCISPRTAHRALTTTLSLCHHSCGLTPHHQACFSPQSVPGSSSRPLHSGSPWNSVLLAARPDLLLPSTLPQGSLVGLKGTPSPDLGFHSGELPKLLRQPHYFFFFF